MHNYEKKDIVDFLLSSTKFIQSNIETIESLEITNYISRTSNNIYLNFDILIHLKNIIPFEDKVDLNSEFKDLKNSFLSPNQHFIFYIGKESEFSKLRNPSYDSLNKEYCKYFEIHYNWFCSIFKSFIDNFIKDNLCLLIKPYKSVCDYYSEMDERHQKILKYQDDVTSFIKPLLNINDYIVIGNDLNHLGLGFARIKQIRESNYNPLTIQKIRLDFSDSVVKVNNINYYDVQAVLSPENFNHLKLQLKAKKTSELINYIENNPKINSVKYFSKHYGKNIYEIF